jgi:beta-glucosidase
LVAFERRTIAAGETATFTFSIGAAELGFWLADGRFTVEPGRFVLHVGGALERTQPVSLQVR